MHRPSNVDDPVALARLTGVLRKISERQPLAFSVHPRTRQNMDKFGIDPGPGITLLEPMA